MSSSEKVSQQTERLRFLRKKLGRHWSSTHLRAPEGLELSRRLDQLEAVARTKGASQ